MGMRVSYNARSGSDFRQPESYFIKQLVCPKGQLQAEFLAFCREIGLPDHQLEVFEEWGDDEIQGLSLDIALAMEIEKGMACRLVAKAQGLAQKLQSEGVTRGPQAQGTLRDRVRSQLLQMLQREDALRLSDEVQAQYALQPESWEWKWEVTDRVQRQVCEEFGFADCVEEGLDLLRSAMSLFPDDEEIKDAAHYLRNNIHVKCPLRVGEIVPDVPLHKLQGGETSVHALAPQSPDGVTLVLAGSHT
mmetsp:Transcript_2951/g.4843  ORF Transcript_2951/g.4843 Transcript_2951/m.4843 type:complete len:247 (-) Transcript_2951:659-1399(-)